MRIAIDARELLGRPTGVGRYLAGILRAWNGQPDAAAHEFILCAPQPAAVSGTERLRVSSLSRAGSGTVWEQLTLPRLVRLARADVLFSPAYSAPLRCPAPTVVAIHDVSFAAHPEWFGWREGFRRRLLARLSARRAARVLTLTEFSKSELVTRLRVPAEKVDVTYAGAFDGPRLTEDETSERASSACRVLYVGSIFERRHVPELIAAFARLAAVRPEVSLDIVGENRTRPFVDLLATSREAGVADRVRLTSYVDDHALQRLYRGAAAFAWLSSYEGFGLTPLEALHAGVPVLLLDTPVAREVYGDAAVYVALPRPDLIAAGLERVLFERAERQRILQAAAPLLARYTWRRTAAAVLDALVASAA